MTTYQSQTLLRSEVADILKSLVYTVYIVPGASSEFQAGYVAALSAVAIALGVPQPQPERRTLLPRMLVMREAEDD